MLKELKILSDHGKRYVKDLRNQPVSDRFRGRPVISAGITAGQIETASAACPVNAIDPRTTGAVDLGRCTFCNECALMIPEAYRFTNDYRIAANRREDPVIRPGSTGNVRIDEASVRKDVRRLFRRSLKLRQVSAGGDNSCEMELAASGNVNFDVGRYGVEFVASPRHADGIVLTGPGNETWPKPWRYAMMPFLPPGLSYSWAPMQSAVAFLKAVLPWIAGLLRPIHLTCMSQKSGTSADLHQRGDGFAGAVNRSIIVRLMAVTPVV